MRDGMSKAARTGARVTFFALLPLLVLAGCRNSALDEAQQQAREAKAMVEKLKFDRNKALDEVSTVNAELSAVRQSRDALQKQVEQLIRERDEATAFAQQAQEAVSRLTAQGGATVALQRQVTELKTLVDEQQQLIEQLQKSATIPPEPVEPVEQASSPTEPNQAL